MVINYRNNHSLVRLLSALKTKIKENWKLIVFVDLHIHSVIDNKKYKRKKKKKQKKKKTKQNKQEVLFQCN